MKNLRYLFTTSVGKKTLVGLTGLALSGFVLMHMAGNLLLFVGADAYNGYSHALITNPLLPLAEIGLVVFFLVHVFLAISISLSNRRAHPSHYQVTAPRCQKGASFASKSMIYTGLLVLVFTVLHLITFKYGAFYAVTTKGVEMRDLYRLVIEKFQEPGYVAWYVFALIILGIHLSHGFAACFQSLGIASVRNRRLQMAGQAFAWVVAVGFMSQPLYLFFRR
jgi:succinate dehydrogenase / fumarate reductase cytochrome b subunit